MSIIIPIDPLNLADHENIIKLLVKHETGDVK